MWDFRPADATLSCREWTAVSLARDRARCVGGANDGPTNTAKPFALYGLMICARPQIWCPFSMEPLYQLNQHIIPFNSADAWEWHS
jgi:hypothetical protein